MGDGESEGERVRDPRPERNIHIKFPIIQYFILRISSSYSYHHFVPIIHLLFQQKIL